MKIKIEKPRYNVKYLMRRCGYTPWRDPRTGKERFIRRLGRGYYPRFHVKASYDNQYNLILDLHLDARRPMHKRGIRTYENVESEVVRREAERIRNLLAK
jgi:RNA 3'-terminal phosphate cyclase